MNETDDGLLTPQDEEQLALNMVRRRQINAALDPVLQRLHDEGASWQDLADQLHMIADLLSRTQAEATERMAARILATEIAAAIIAGRWPPNPASAN